MGIGPSEWLIIILVLVVLFGAKKIPELAKGLGQGIREFKKAASAASEDDEKPSKPNATPGN
jgi:sec-independent protein translocase protein TatA